MMNGVTARTSDAPYQRKANARAGRGAVLNAGLVSFAIATHSRVAILHAAHANHLNHGPLGSGKPLL
jgi:hypothetical protein